MVYHDNLLKYEVIIFNMEFLY